MNKITLLYILLFALTGAFPFKANAQGISPAEALGKPYVHPSIFSFLHFLDTFQSSINPTKNSYTLSALNQGLEMEFNFNMMLNSIWMHGNTGRFKPYTQTLPYKLKWGMNQDQMAATPYLFIPDSNNFYVMTKSISRGKVTAYFYDNRLSSLKFECDPALLQKEDSTFISQWGIRIYPDGTCKHGDCVTGYGVMMFEGETGAYEGDWKYGFPNGKGKLTDPGGNTWEGQFVQGFPWGKQILISPESFVYEGPLYYGRRYGKGKIVYKNGEIYDGDWVNDTMHGTGTYYFNPTYHYKGSFKNGKFNGAGKLSTPEGIFEGSFKDGKPHGQGKQMVYRTQATYSGKWINGSKEGKFQYHDPLSGNREIRFKNDKEIVEE